MQRQASCFESKVQDKSSTMGRCDQNSQREEHLPRDERLVGLRNLAWQRAQQLQAKLIKEDG